MKRKLVWVLIFALTFGLFVGCSNNPGDTDSDGSDDSVSTEEAKTVLTAYYDENTEHKIIVSDIKNASIVVFDLDACEGDYEVLKTKEAVVWEWFSRKSSSKYVSNIGAGIDEAKYRYSPYYETDVIVATSSAGWAGVISYPSGEVLWEATLSNCPHSIEMLPNGDVVVAGSGGDAISNGELVYYPLSTGRKTYSSRVKISSCHAACWDPEQEVIWSIGYDGVYAVRVNNYGDKEAKLAIVDGLGAKFGDQDKSGHDLMPAYGTDSQWWGTAGGYLWVFDSETGVLNRKYTSGASKGGLKGVASFADGTLVQTVAGGGGDTTYDWSTLQLRILTRRLSTGKIQTAKYDETTVTFTDREFYKVHTFTKNYR